ncbi:hypothetical protein PFLUV_G00183260 [Perca fluviatilis]|uniref:Uncharacterized protein n=1 Tax=Perca fluviatilis TaxID=8168 RepID=A0A6A5EMM2_PERFL|nr:hypothetical protein PFLUV_G00183260 [Perca fluviatilis]
MIRQFQSPGGPQAPCSNSEDPLGALHPLLKICAIGKAISISRSPTLVQTVTVIKLVITSFSAIIRSTFYFLEYKHKPAHQPQCTVCLKLFSTC